MSSRLSPVVMVLLGAVGGAGLVLLIQGGGDDVVVGGGDDAAAPPVLAVPDDPAGDAPGAGKAVEVGTGEGMEDGGEAPLEEGGEPGFEDLMAKVFAGDASDDEQLEFWELMRKTDKIDGVIDSLTAIVEADATDVTSRMTLAQVYVMKLLSVPPGPAQGLLSEKSQALWNQVLELDPDHFEAQYRIAFSLSQYPDFLNKTDEAIEAFEKAIEIEGRTGPSAQTAQAYEALARVHQKSGDPASALEVLERGLEVHPENARIGGQLEKLKRGFVFEER